MKRKFAYVALCACVWGTGCGETANVDGLNGKPPQVSIPNPDSGSSPQKEGDRPSAPDSALEIKAVSSNASGLASSAVAAESKSPPEASLNSTIAPAVKAVPAFQKRFPAPETLTAFDLMTPEDEFYYHHLSGMCSGADLSTWPLVKALTDLGQNLVNANLLASLANETIHISDQPRAAPIVKIVKECADVLGIEAPAVHIQGGADANARVLGLREPYVLVLTSDLLELFEENPDELRFLIGHELGHIKTNHIKTHFLGNSLVSAVAGDRGASASFAPDFIASLTIGALMHWHRESEYSADRAGLICVGGDLKTAKQALLRLMHQTKPSNKLFDPSHSDFDADLVLKNQMRLREEPFVKIMSYLRQSRQAHPYIPERCAALDSWAHSAEFQTILDRAKPSSSSSNRRMLAITSIQIRNIPKVDSYVPLVDSGAADPFAKIACAGAIQETSHGVDMVDADWADLKMEFDFKDGASLILELYDYNSALSNTLIGSCILPVRLDSNGKGSARGDVRLDVLQSSTVVDRPTVVVEYRISEPSAP